VSRTLLLGMGVSPGVVIGEPVIHETRMASAMRMPVAPPKLEAEVERFRQAVRDTVERIGEHRERAADQMGPEYGAIFEAQQLIASDPTFIDDVEKIIRSEEVNAEWAIDQVVADLVAKFENVGDVYLSERKLDVLDVATQVLQTLQGLNLRSIQHLDRPVIVVADDLPPSQAVQLPLDLVLGFVLQSGGPTSHTTIIARSFGIPAIVGAPDVCAAAQGASLLAMDAYEGRMIFDPNPAEISEYESRQREHLEQQAHLSAVRTLPTITRDGHRMSLLANIDLPPELEHALHWNVDGVGLYRSEFLYMKMSPYLPSEEEHLGFYRSLVRQVGDLPVTIRTFDLGGKKLAREVIGSPEANPVLGLRGIRLCLNQPEFFGTQLRALLRLAGEFPEGLVRIMLPLVSGVEEIRITRLFIRQLTEELRSEGHSIPDSVPLGAMIEVPSAAVLAQEIAREVDFLSIGTNDLIQYTLAVDRSNELVAHLYRSNHPAIFRLIQHVIQAGEAAGIEVSMCGETAADPLMVPVLLGLGLRNLSMNPHSVPVVRSLIRQLSYRESALMARQALQLPTAREVEEYLLERLSISFAKIKIRV